MCKRFWLFWTIMLAIYGAGGANAFAQGNDPLGVRLPPGLTRGQLVALVAPGKDPALATLVGAKRWRYRPNTYIAIACISPNKKRYVDAVRGIGASCPVQSHFYPDQPPGEVYLAMIEYAGEGAAPVAIAGDGKPLDIAVSWQYFSDADNVPDQERPETYERFDFAPYKLTDRDTAFGIRVGWQQGYAGGGASWDALLLFVRSDNKLVNVLAQPMSYGWDLAGDWNPDGTRNHDSGYKESVLIVLPHQTNGHHDLRLRESGGKWKQDFIWDKAQGRYMVNPAPKKR